MMGTMWDRLQFSSEAPAVPQEGLAAVLAPIFADRDGTLRLVLTKRSRNLSSHAGQVAFPGGKPHLEDAGPVETALRETHEEVGIHPSEVEVLGFLPVIRTVRFALPMVGIVARIGDEPAFDASPEEVERVLTPSLETLVDPESWVVRSWSGVPLWFMDVSGEWLWGATAYLVRVMLGLPVTPGPADLRA